MNDDREGQALALRWAGGDSLDRTIARDRPSRYGNRGVIYEREKQKPSPYRRAGACPPPCCGLRKTLFMNDDREGQALALR